MTHEDSLFEDFCQLILDKMGLRFTKENQKELERKLALMSKELGFQNPQDCLQWFVHPPFNQKKLDLLATHLTVGETYFFREAPLFEILHKKILPEFISLRKNTQHLSIWSAGCCTGEEIYSIAILLDQLLPSPNHWSIHLIGTDINPEFLRRARLGQYREWSLRNTSEEIKKKYFIKEGELFTLLPSIREKVEFYPHNLVDPTSPSLRQIDLILCHNVIIYLSPSHIQRVVQKLTDALSEEGWLSVSSIEAPYILDPTLLSVPLEGIPFFKKKTALPSFSPTKTPSPLLSTPVSFPKLPPSPVPLKAHQETLIDQKKTDRQVLRERARKLTHPIHSQEKKESLQVVVFYLNKETYAIECKYMREIHPCNEWTVLPHLPPFIKGVIHVRRKVVSVIDLKKFFGLSDEYPSSLSPLIILEESQKEFAILTDGVEGIREIVLEEIQAPLSTLTGIEQEFLKGFTADRLLILDGKKLLEDDRLVIR